MTANELLMQFQADVLGVPGDPPDGDRDDGARRGLRGGPGRPASGQDQDELRERWAEDKRWEPQMDADERERQYARWKKAVQRSLDWVD